MNDAPLSTKGCSVFAALVPNLTRLEVGCHWYKLDFEGLGAICSLQKLESLVMFGDFHCSRCVMEGSLTSLRGLTHLRVVGVSSAHRCDVPLHQGAAVQKQEVSDWAVESFPRLCALEWDPWGPETFDRGGAGRQGVAAITSLPEVLPYDERIKYTRTELLDIRGRAAFHEGVRLQALPAAYDRGPVTVRKLVSAVCHNRV
jgi:hypothetical protein